jgi:group II intron reverse transcriptase/maturase
VASLEDKVVQRALVEVLNAIYEPDFLGFSYGFRPGRSQHDALDATVVGVERRKVSWVLDADVADFFTGLDLGWMAKFLEHRIADKRILRLIQQWLTAGVVDEGTWTACEKGTPQGAVVSPLLANVYLHYVLDLWADRWRRRSAKGDVIIVRYADDFIVGFQYREEAQRFQRELRERFAKFGLELKAEKTRIIEFGRFAAKDRKARGLGGPETFNFLGFTYAVARPETDAIRSSESRSRNGCAPSSGRSRPNSGGECISPSRRWGAGWEAWCAGISPTSPCPATATPSWRLSTRSSGTG